MFTTVGFTKVGHWVGQGREGRGSLRVVRVVGFLSSFTFHVFFVRGNHARWSRFSPLSLLRSLSAVRTRRVWPLGYLRQPGRRVVPTAPPQDLIWPSDALQTSIRGLSCGGGFCNTVDRCDWALWVASGRCVHRAMDGSESGRCCELLVALSCRPCSAVSRWHTVKC